MKAVLQRVSSASVTVAGRCVGEIGPGLLVLLGLDRGDDEVLGQRMIEKILAYRVFPDRDNRMNLSVREAGGGVLLVSQFTLSADTAKGLRPGFSSALPPAQAEALFDWMLEQLKLQYQAVAAGEFGADMQVALVNDGPVTFLLEMTAG